MRETLMAPDMRYLILFREPTKSPLYTLMVGTAWGRLRSLDPQVLRSMKHLRPELCSGRLIFIDCSTWNSKRVMQKKNCRGAKS
jgi:hypothetical protein